MKVTHINTTDVAGGAARAAYRLHTGLQQAGISSSMFVRERKGADPSVKAYNPPQDLQSKARRWLRRKSIRLSFRRYRRTRPPGFEPFTDDRTPFEARIFSQLPSSGIVNLHWIRNFIDVKAFFANVSAPVVWTLHDMNAFTGGCHYDDGCGKYTAACGACPQLGSAEEQDLSRQVWQRKRDAYEQIGLGRLHIVALCRWMEREVKRSALLGQFPVSVVPNGLDTEIFAPREKQATRRALEIPSEARVILFVAQSVSNRRKGFELLTEALTDLDRRKEVYLISVGSHAPALNTNIPHLHLGKVGSDRLLSVIYSTADLFIIPSLQDNLPNTVLESMACGTPVVGFDAGGIPDMVRLGETGWLAPVGDVRALRDAIVQALSDDTAREAVAKRCREVAVEEYAVEVQAKRYIKLYESMLSGEDDDD